MPRPAQFRFLPLPRAWPRRVPSAAVHAISLVDLAFTKALGRAADALNPRIRLRAELERLGREASMREEIRIKDARMDQIEPHRRPYYPPAARLAILELRAARGWTMAQAARSFLVSPLTIASWTDRLIEEGPDALVRLPVPVNRFPVFVGYLVKRLRTLCPSLGKVRITQILARAGLHLAPATVRRMLRNPERPKEPSTVREAPHTVTARHPNHVWHVDLTTVPIALGFWIPWVPFARPRVWPFCWWVALAVDHFSRRVMGFAVFRGEPSSAAVRRFLKGVFRSVGQRPRHLISDQGTQFIAKGFSQEREPAGNARQISLTHFSLVRTALRVRRGPLRWPVVPPSRYRSLGIGARGLAEITEHNRSPALRRREGRRTACRR